MADAQFGIALVGQDLSGPAWQSFINNARAATKQVQDLRAPMDSLVGLAKQARGAFAVVWGNEIFQKAREFHSQIQEQVGALKDQADGLGLTTDQLQAYIAAFGKSGYAAEAARGTLNKFNQTMGEAKLGNQGAIDSFERLKVKLLDASGKMRDPNDVMAESAEKLLAMKEGAERTALSMQIFGRSGGQLTPVLRDLALGITELTRQAAASGTVIDKETIEAFEKLNRSSNTLELQVRTLYAQIAAPIQTKAVDAASSAFKTLSDRIKEAKFSWVDFILYGPVAYAAKIALTGTESEQAASDVRTLGAALESTRQTLAAMGTDDARRAFTEKAVADMQDRLLAAKQRAAQFDEDKARVHVLPETVVTAPGVSNPTGSGSGSGSGGAGARDRIGEALRQLQAQADASAAAYKRLRDAANNSIPLKDLEREVALQKDIADELARIGKYSASDPRIPAIKSLIKVREEADSKAKAFDETLKLADATSRQYGDGQRGLAEDQKKLGEAFATGRVPLDAYLIAMQQTAQAADDLRLKNIGLKGGFEGFLAGFENARNQFVRANNAFAVGGRLYEQVMADMSSATDALFNNTQVNFASIAMGWAKMLVDMEMRAAVSNIWGLLSGGATNAGIFGNLFGAGAGTVPPVTATTNTIPDIGSLISTLPAFAGGGDYQAGVPRVIGEDGWEIDIPKTSGTVINQKQLAGLGGDGDITVVINNTNQFGSVVSRAEMDDAIARNAEATRKAAIAGVQDAKSRGGAYRSTLRR